MREIEMNGITYVKVQVNPAAVVQETIDMFRRHYKINNIDGINDKGYMFENVEYHTSHSWSDNEDRGKPTKEQKEALSAVNLLKSLMNAVR